MFGFLETVLGGAAAGIGFVLGLGATLAGSQVVRPFAREAVKGAMAVTDRAKEITAGLAESVEDIVAEAKAEREASPQEEAPAVKKASARRPKAAPDTSAEP